MIMFSQSETDEKLITDSNIIHDIGILLLNFNTFTDCRFKFKVGDLSISVMAIDKYCRNTLTCNVNAI